LIYREGRNKNYNFFRIVELCHASKVLKFFICAQNQKIVLECSRWWLQLWTGWIGKK